MCKICRRDDDWKMLNKKFIIIILLLAACTSFVNADLTDNITSYWKFDIDSSTQVDSLGLNDGTVSGATFNSNGKINADYSYDGTNDNIAMTDSSSLDISGNTISFGAWINATISGGMDGSAASIMAKSDTSGDDGGYALFFDDRGGARPTNGIICLISDGVSFIGGVVDSGNNVITDGGYHHVLCVYNGVDIRIYVDGNQTGDIGTTTNNIGTNARDLIFGEDSIGSFDFTGSIDEGAIWHRNLSTSEILELYNNDTGLSYPFSETVDLSILVSSYNMTSDEGCIVWRTNTSENCNTTDSKPPMVLETNVDADCSIRTTQSDNDTFSYNTTFDCQTTGGTSHDCNTYESDILVFGQNYNYVSCTDGSTNATSGALALNMTLQGVDYNIYTSFSTLSKMVIELNGRVGIGTINPNYKLEVNGTIKADSFIGDGSQLTGTASTFTGGSITSDIDMENNSIVDIGKIGIGTGSPTEAIHLAVGDILVGSTKASVGGTNLCYDGSGESYWGACTSLTELKINSNNLTMNWFKYSKLNPRTYYWKNINWTQDIQVGFFAEEVESVHPSLAEYNIWNKSTNTSQLSGVNFNAITALNVEAIQELKKENIMLKDYICSIDPNAGWC